MERVWALIPLLLIVGCAGSKAVMKPMTDLATKVEKTVLPGPPEPVSYCMCFWQNRLQQVPDPVNNGRMQVGMVGQAFLLDAATRTTEVNGELTIRVTDTTTTAGHQPHTTEVWNFSAQVLKDKRVNDERWGQSHALYIPWPAEWRDVNRVSIQARYDAPNQPTVYSQEYTVTLDLTSGPGASAGGVVPWNQGGSAAVVPDPRLARQTSQPAPPMNNGPIVPANNVTTFPSSPKIGNVQAWAGPTPGSTPMPPQGNGPAPISDGQRIIIKR